MNLMVGFSTQQNTVNLIPAIQLDIDKFIILETSLANKNAWSKGLKQVLEKRKIKVESILLEPEQDNKIDKIYKLLIDKFENSNDKIIWNLGGGQKPHQIAIWNTFKELNNSEHLVCYSNPNSKKIEIWTSDLKYKEEDINVNITIEEIFTTYGQVINDKGKKIYQKGKKMPPSQLKDFFKYREFREYFFSRSGVNIEEKNSETYTLQEINNKLRSFEQNQELKNNMSKKSNSNKNYNLENYTFSVKNDVIKFIIKNFSDKKPSSREIELKNPDFIKELKEINYLHKTLKTDYELINLICTRVKKTPANYFEEVLEKRTQEILESTDKENHILEAYANLKTGDKKVGGEYDIILVTTKGTLIALDAKTFDVDKKDSDARLYNLTLAGGIYVNWIPVIPYDIECTRFMSKSLEHLPKTLNDFKKKFYVISDNHKEDYEHEIETYNIKMILFDNFLNE